MNGQRRNERKNKTERREGSVCVEELEDRGLGKGRESKLGRKEGPGTRAASSPDLGSEKLER